MNYAQHGQLGVNVELQQKYAAQAAAQTNYAATPLPEKPRESEATFNQIADQLMRMGAQLERLRELTNRTVGPRPEAVPTVGHGGTAGIPAALSGRLNMIFDALNIANQRLADDLNRLDQFV